MKDDFSKRNKSVVHVDLILRDRKHFLREQGKDKKTKLLGILFAKEAHY